LFIGFFAYLLCAKIEKACAKKVSAASGYRIKAKDFARFRLGFGQQSQRVLNFWMAFLGKVPTTRAGSALATLK
jgi:hypothetical protein